MSKIFLKGTSGFPEKGRGGTQSHVQQNNNTDSAEKKGGLVSALQRRVNHTSGGQASGGLPVPFFEKRLPLPSFP